ncbi:MCP four helix bundle domain-containing protein, partial [Methanoregula sp.]|uniref:MCP four helix bundle domain-containing protein n=1 Tax=Methanoregula sp. TaxID=2052170 RepID=UPI0025EF37C9
MSFIDDMKIGKKLIGGFLIVVIILAIVAAYGYINAQSAATRSAEMYEDATIPISLLGNVQADFQQLRAEIYRFIYVPEARGSLDTTMNDLDANIQKNMAEFRNRQLSAAEQTTLAKFDASYAEFMKLYRDTKEAARANNMEKVNADLSAGSPLINARTATVAAYKDLIQLNTNKAKNLADQTAADAATASILLAVLTIAGIIIALAVAITLTRGITGPVNMVAANLKELSMGHLGNRMKMNRKDEIGEMAEVMDQFSDDLQNNVIGTMQKIANGDLSSDVKAKDAQDEIGPALRTTTESLRTLVAEANMLSKAAIAGQLSTRGNADKFKGGYKEIIQ